MRPDYNRALRDFAQGIGNIAFWGRLGWYEIRRRYRRTVLGPFWMTASLSILLFSMGIIWSQLFGQEMATYMPFLAAGVICWSLFAAFVNEGCTLFLTGANLITTMQFPYSVLACSMMWRNVIVLLHNLLVLVAVYVFWWIPVHPAVLLFIPGLFLVGLNGIWIGTLLGLMSTRFRDIPNLVAGLLQVVMLITPIFWSPDSLKGRASHTMIVEYNPVYHYIEVMRAPLLGHAPGLTSYAVVIAGTVIGWWVTLMMYSRFRRRIPYWI
jgi:ABC-type polysaccharide/polyol phosphate export permease